MADACPLDDAPSPLISSSRFSPGALPQHPGGGGGEPFWAVRSVGSAVKLPMTWALFFVVFMEASLAREGSQEEQVDAVELLVRRLSR